MASDSAQIQQEKADEKFAQQLQQAEHGQAPAPVVVGVPVGQAPVGAARAAAGGLPYVADVIVGPQLPPEEILVLRYRFSMMCFASIDLVSTALDAGTGFVAAIQLSQEHRDTEAIWSEALVGILGLVFLAGPVCGLIGARTLRRRLVAVYLAFCIMKTALRILLALVTPYLWYVLVGLVQLWITKIAFTFWSSLRAIPAARLAELLEPQTLHSTELRFVYW